LKSTVKTFNNPCLGLGVMHGITLIKDVVNPSAQSLGRMGMTLSTLAQKNAAVAPSFVVTSTALKEFVILSGIRDRVFSLLRAKKTEQLYHVLLNQEVPADLEEDLFSHCTQLKAEQFVVHSSSTFLDHDFKAHVSSKHKVLDAIKKAWASIVVADRMPLLNRNNLFSAVVVQADVLGAKKGKLYTVNPLTNSKEKVVIHVNQPQSHILLLAKGDGKGVSENDFHTLGSPLLIDEKDQLLKMASAVSEAYPKPSVVDWVKLGDTFAITSAIELGEREKQHFFAVAKANGLEMDKI